jgi:hypothetical protein
VSCVVGLLWPLASPKESVHLISHVLVLLGCSLFDKFPAHFVKLYPVQVNDKIIHWICWLNFF